MGGDARPDIALPFADFGIDVLVTRPAPNDTPIEATGIWMTPSTLDVPVSGGFQRREAKRAMALRRSEVPTVPHGTVILAALPGVTTATHWRVDAPEIEEAEYVTVTLLAAPDLDEA